MGWSAPAFELFAFCFFNGSRQLCLREFAGPVDQLASGYFQDDAFVFPSLLHNDIPLCLNSELYINRFGVYEIRITPLLSSSEK